MISKQKQIDKIESVFNKINNGFNLLIRRVAYRRKNIFATGEDAENIIKGKNRIKGKKIKCESGYWITASNIIGDMYYTSDMIVDDNYNWNNFEKDFFPRLIKAMK